MMETIVAFLRRFFALVRGQRVASVATDMPEGRRITDTSETEVQEIEALGRITPQISTESPTPILAPSATTLTPSADSNPPLISPTPTSIPTSDVVATSNGAGSPIHVIRKPPSN